MAGKIDQAYERYRPTALRVLRRRCPWLAADERLGVYHDAFATLLEKHRQGSLNVEEMHDAQVRGYLLTAAVHRGLGEGARAERRRAIPTAEPGIGVIDPAEPMEDRLDDELGMLAVRELVEELPERRRAVIKLRFWLDRSPNEIKAFLGISERVYRKEIERAFAQLADRYELVRQGRWCEERRSLVLAYVAGVAGPRRTREARMHLDGCPGCAQMARELRAVAERVAVVLPLPALDRAPIGEAAEAALGAKAQLSDLVGAVKTHISGVAARIDPSSAQYAAGARPGTTVAAIASCVAIGGGATFCAVEGLPTPIGALGPTKQEQGPPSAEEQPPRPPVKPVATQTPTPRPPPTSDQGPVAPPTEPVPPAAAPEPAPDPATEFEPPDSIPTAPAASSSPADASAAFSPGSGSTETGNAGREFAP